MSPNRMLTAQRLAYMLPAIRAGRSLAEIGRHLGVSRERVRQIVRSEGLTWSARQNREQRNAARRLRQLQLSTHKDRMKAEIAIIARARGFDVHIPSRGHALRIDGRRVCVHISGVWRPVHCRHSGYLRFEIRRPDLINICCLRGLRLGFVLPSNRKQVIFVRPDRPAQNYIRTAWPTPTELREAVARIKRPMRRAA